MQYCSVAVQAVTSDNTSDEPRQRQQAGLSSAKPTALDGVTVTLTSLSMIGVQ